jgi:hypothetical protein
MLDILQSYLNDASSPEFTQMIREAHEALDLFGIEHYQDDFVELLMLDDAVDQGETVQNIYDTTRNWLLDVLKLLGVTPADDTPEDARVEHLTRILTGIHAIETSEDPAKLIERAKLEYPPEELLAELLAVVTPISPEEWLIDIHVVSQMLIQKIIENASQALSLKDNDDESVDHRVKYIQEYKDFKATVQAKGLKATMLMDEYFRTGMDVGYPIVVYLNLAGQTIGTLEPVDCAVNLISMALVSTDGHETPREAIHAHLEHYINDLDVLTKVDIAVSQILLQHQIYKTSGVKKS